jgi:hypothetical protein
MRPVFLTASICLLSALFSQALIAQPSVMHGVSNQPVIFWDGASLVESSFLGTRIRCGDPKTGTFQNIDAPTGTDTAGRTGALGISVWNGVVSVLQLKDGHIIFSRRSSEGVWQDFPTSLDGPHDIQGVPFTLNETERSDRFFAMNVGLGFAKGNEGSISSWWRQRNDGALEPESIVPIELDYPVFLAVSGTKSSITTQLSARYLGLAPFLEYPIRVPGAFLVVSWNAGVIWVIKDGYPFSSRTIKLISLDEEHLAGKIRHPPVLLGIQPMLNGHVLIAMRSEKAILDSPKEKPKEPSKEKVVTPAQEGNSPSIPVMTHPEILWKDLDPIEGTLSDADAIFLGDAPRTLSSEAEAWHFVFKFDLNGHLVFPKKGSAGKEKAASKTIRATEVNQQRQASRTSPMSDVASPETQPSKPPFTQ